MENILLDVMYTAPDHAKTEPCTLKVTEECITKKEFPKLLKNSKREDEIIEKKAVG
jgi:ATP-dependent protease Clp ATPase subunit